MNLRKTFYANSAVSFSLMKYDFVGHHIVFVLK